MKGRSVSLGWGLTLAAGLWLTAAASAQDGPADPDGAAAPAPAAPSAPQSVPVEMRFPTEPVLLGDWFDVSVGGDLPAEAYLAFEPEEPDEFVRTRPGAPVVEDGVRWLRLQVSVTRTGQAAVEGLVLRRPSGDQPLPPVEVDVTLDLPAGKTPRVADFLEPVAVPMPPANAAPFIATLVVFFLILAIVLLTGTRTVVPDLPVPPPDLVAVRALARLRSRLPRTQEEVPPFVDEVSDVLRLYIELRFHVHAPEQTTEEFMQQVGRLPALESYRDEIEPFLTLCDLVKFARHQPGLDQVADLLVTAERFVEQTRDADEYEEEARDPVPMGAMA